MTEAYPLAIWGEQLPGDLEAIKAAKAALALPFLVIPCPAVPSSPTRILALRTPPPFVGEHALVRDPQNPAAMLAGLAWVLNPASDDPRATTAAQQLSAWFGCDVRELAPEPYSPPTQIAEPKRRLRWN